MWRYMWVVVCVMLTAIAVLVVSFCASGVWYLIGQMLGGTI